WLNLRSYLRMQIADKKLWASRPDVPARCVVSANACWYFKSVADEAEQASLNVLARHTVASALEAVKNADTSGCDPVPEMIARFKKAH
ncbi:TPA: transcriptional regulator, partial [Klebsiella pneumoniae]|nr:transcriptional regulator [Klebsiella pneumoniae]